jgi:uncharacterized membrane protein
MGELTCIDAVIVGHGSGLMVGFVAVVLTLGLLGVVSMVWLPWLLALRKRDSVGYKTLFWSCCAVLAVVGAESVLLIIQAVGSTDKVERIESLAQDFQRESNAVNLDIERNIHENDSLQIQMRADARASAEVSGRLIRAQAEHAPPVVIKSLALRLKEELAFSKIDGDRAVQLSEEAAHFFKKQERIYEELAPDLIRP